jgi:hypothetical protein
MRKGTTRPTGFGRAFLLWALLLGLGSGCAPRAEDPFLGGLSLAGYEQAGPLIAYNQRTLFDYVDGEAEIYLPLGFRLLYSQTYSSLGTGALVVADAYHMGGAAGAERTFARFTEEGGAELRGIGDAAWTDEHVVLFRRGPYCVRIWPDPSPEPQVRPNRSDLIQLAKALAASL